MYGFTFFEKDFNRFNEAKIGNKLLITSFFVEKNINDCL